VLGLSVSASVGKCLFTGGNQALTADNQMTRKPNLALNAEIVSSGRAAITAQPQLHDPK